MLTLTDQLTAVELIKRGGFTDDQRSIIEVMSTINELLYDAPVVEANDGTVHTQTVRTALPHGTHRAYNQGVTTDASQTKVIHDVICELAAYSEVDKKLVQHAVNSAQFLTDECSSFIEGMGQDQAYDMVYGNHTKNEGEINGFATRRNKVGDLVIDAGGTGNNLTSIYLIKWGQKGVKYIYPRGASGMAITRDDRGIQDVQKFDASGNPAGRYQAYVNYFSAEYGIAVGDERSLIRIANIDPASNSFSGTDLAKIIMKASNKLMPGGGTVSLLCNSDVKTMLDIAAMEKNNVVMHVNDPWGANITQVCGARLRRCDVLTNTETQVR